MNALVKAKFYLTSICGLACLLAILLPWMSYGVGSKTGLDIGKTSLSVLTICGCALVVLTFVDYKMRIKRKIMPYLALCLSICLLGVFAFEILRIAYQTMVAKSIPTEMFGIVALSAKQIHIGYGLWVGAIAGFLASLISYVEIRASIAKK